MIAIWRRKRNDLATGTYETDPTAGSTAEQLARGELKFTLRGQTLRGRFVLIRTGLRSAAERKSLTGPHFRGNVAMPPKERAPLRGDNG